MLEKQNVNPDAVRALRLAGMAEKADAAPNRSLPGEPTASKMD